MSSVPPPAEPEDGETAVMAAVMEKVRSEVARPTHGTVTDTGILEKGGASLTLHVT